MLEVTWRCSLVSSKPRIHAAVGILFILSAVVLWRTAPWLRYHQLSAVAVSVFSENVVDFTLKAASSVRCFCFLCLSLFCGVFPSSLFRCVILYHCESRFLFWRWLCLPLGGQPGADDVVCSRGMLQCRVWHRPHGGGIFFIYFFGT